MADDDERDDLQRFDYERGEGRVKHRWRNDYAGFSPVLVHYAAHRLVPVGGCRPRVALRSLPMAEARSDAGSSSRQLGVSWRKRVLARLHDGRIDEVVKLLGELNLKGARSGDDEVPRQEFFIKRAHRLRYDRIRELNLPEGSGAIESVIRRVVNLRMKGNAKYWNEENAPHTMFLRAQLRTGRFDSFMAWSRAQQAWWWTKSDRSRLRYAEHGKEVRFAA